MGVALYMSCHTGREENNAHNEKVERFRKLEGWLGKVAIGRVAVVAAAQQRPPNAQNAQKCVICYDMRSTNNNRPPGYNNAVHIEGEGWETHPQTPTQQTNGRQSGDREKRDER